MPKGTSEHAPTEYVEPDPSLSSDAQHSTYEASPDGVGSIQTKGVPTESSADDTTGSAPKRSTSRSSPPKDE